MDNQDLTKQIEEVQAQRQRNELRRLQLLEAAERTELRQLEAGNRAKRSAARKQVAAERAKRIGRINIEALREEIKSGLLKGGRGAYSSALSNKSRAWRQLLNMLRQPNESQQRLEAEGILRQLKVKYYDGDDRGKGYARMFYYEPVDIPMTEEVKIW